jgi:5-methylcytosine-specific restriction enzyme A
MEESCCASGLPPLDIMPTTSLRPDGKPAPGALRLGVPMPMKPCAASGCRSLVDIGTSHCKRHLVEVKAERWRESDKARTTKKSRKWYNQAAWRGKSGRRLAQLGAEPLCSMCPDWSRQPATIADHITPHREDHGLFWFGALQSLCKTCHDIKKQRVERRDSVGVSAFRERRLPTRLLPSRVPLVIVTGPTAGGKSTYVRERAGPSDIVIDLDFILQELSGLPEHHADGRWLKAALDRRNAMLADLALDSVRSRAWFIISAPDPRERAHWHRMLGGDLVVLRTPLSDCIDRIAADPARQGFQTRMIDAARDWWLRQA